MLTLTQLQAYGSLVAGVAGVAIALYRVAIGDHDPLQPQVLAASVALLGYHAAKRAEEGAPGGAGAAP